MNKESKEKGEFMFKRAILVDYENVVNEGLAYVDRLSEENKVVIFYSKNANSMTFQTHQKLMDSKATIEYMEVTVGGRNALDIQLATYLGYLAGKADAEEYYMISKDNGFRHVEIFCEQKLHLNISCKPYIGKYFLDDEKEESQIIESVKQEETESIETEVKEELKEEQKETENSLEYSTEENVQDPQQTLEKAEETDGWVQEQELEIHSEGFQEFDEKKQTEISMPLALPVKAKAEVFIFNGTGFTKEEDIKEKILETKKEEKEEPADFVKQIQESEVEFLDKKENDIDIKDIKKEEKSESIEVSKIKETDQNKKETHKNKMTGTEVDAVKTKKKKKKNQNIEQKEQEQKEQKEEDYKEETVKLQKSKKKTIVIADEKALENAIQKAFETYRDKKLKTEVMMNFIKTGQKKALYNMLRGKLGQTEGQKVYNILKQYIEESA